MPNLKANLDEELALLSRCGDEIKEKLESMVDAAKQRLREGAAAVADLPAATATDLMLKSEVAQSVEIVFEYAGEVNCLVDFVGRGYGKRMTENGQRVPAGKYRALFFLIPIKE